eukprot:181410_1
MMEQKHQSSQSSEEWIDFPQEHTDELLCASGLASQHMLDVVSDKDKEISALRNQVVILRRSLKAEELNTEQMQADKEKLLSAEEKLKSSVDTLETEMKNLRSHKNEYETAMQENTESVIKMKQENESLQDNSQKLRLEMNKLSVRNRVLTESLAKLEVEKAQLEIKSAEKCAVLELKVSEECTKRNDLISAMGRIEQDLASMKRKFEREVKSTDSLCARIQTLNSDLKNKIEPLNEKIRDLDKINCTLGAELARARISLKETEAALCGMTNERDECNKRSDDTQKKLGETETAFERVKLENTYLQSQLVQSQSVMQHKRLEMDNCSAVKSLEEIHPKLDSLAVASNSFSDRLEKSESALLSLSEKISSQNELECEVSALRSAVSRMSDELGNRRSRKSDVGIKCDIRDLKSEMIQLKANLNGRNSRDTVSKVSTVPVFLAPEEMKVESKSDMEQEIRSEAGGDSSDSAECGEQSDQGEKQEDVGVTREEGEDEPPSISLEHVQFSCKDKWERSRRWNKATVERQNSALGIFMEFCKSAHIEPARAYLKSAEFSDFMHSKFNHRMSMRKYQMAARYILEKNGIL